jgi:ATP-dependent Clp protease adaptor protein ClpS
MSNASDSTEVVADSKVKNKTKKPPLYKVILLNDNITTMNFVVYVLETVFNKVPSEAVAIMLKVHTEGRGLAGIYPKSIAEAKVAKVISEARGEGYPLQCILERFDD